MNRKLYIGALLNAAFLLAASTTMAQEGPPPPGRGHGHPGEFGMGPGEIELMGFGGPHGGKVVTGAPFTATAVAETTQTLADGSHITQKTQATLFRDSQGRSRKEVSLSGFGPLTAAGQNRSFIMIQDPVAKTGFVLSPEDKTAHQLLARGHDAAGTAEESGTHSGSRSQRVQAGVKTESLGTQKIAGVTAEGTRYTRTIPAGTMGNDAALTIVSERWYSSDLQMVVMSKRSDPRFGETTYTLGNIQRTEPDTSLFTVPSTYTIKQGGPGRGGFRGGPGAPPPPESPDNN